MAMRWRWPPENSCGYRFSASRGRPDLFDQIGRPSRALGAIADALDQQRFGDDGGHRHARIERAERVLEDDLDCPLCRPRRGLVKSLPAKQHRAHGRTLQSRDDIAEGALAAAAFADQCEGLADIDVEADIVDRGQGPPANGELYANAVERDQMVRRRRHGRTLKQATQCRDETSSSGGSACRQPASARPHRSAKRQPRTPSTSATLPGITGRTAFRRAGSGSVAIRPSV